MTHSALPCRLPDRDGRGPTRRLSEWMFSVRLMGYAGKIRNCITEQFP